MSRALTFSQCRTAELLQSARGASGTRMTSTHPKRTCSRKKKQLKTLKSTTNEGPGQRSADIGSCSAICKDELEMLEDNMWLRKMALSEKVPLKMPWFLDVSCHVSSFYHLNRLFWDPIFRPCCSFQTTRSSQFHVMQDYNAMYSAQRNNVLSCAKWAE